MKKFDKDFFKKKKIENMEAELEDAKLGDDDFEEMQNWTDEDFEDPIKVKEHLKKRQKRRKSKDPIVRVDDLEMIMDQYGEDTDPAKIVSMYMPQRKSKRIGALLLRLDKLKLLLLLLLLIIFILFIASFAQEKMGNFTINLDRLELYRKGLSIADAGSFKNPTARLEADTLENASNITFTDLPASIDKIDGSHNGRNYIAYTYYVRNAGKASVDYEASIKLTNSSKGAENAARVAVYRNGKKQVFAEPATGGGAEPGTKKFKDHDTAYFKTVKNFDVGYVDKYTVVIWLEGNDPQCNDSIIGGSMQFEMSIQAAGGDDTSLFQKFIEDIKDTITDNKPINASGDKTPDYYNKVNLTWQNRRNK